MTPTPSPDSGSAPVFVPDSLPTGPVGHPRGIYTLFFTEMWERFSYYGMRALLVLYMKDAIEKGGIGLTDAVATAIYGLYTAVVYIFPLPGGWVGDRLLGARAAVWWGGIIIAVGHLLLGVHGERFFYLGLLVVALGSGLLKSNMSVMVGQLYPEGGTRRDNGYTLFYMGINVGGLLGPLVCSALGESHSLGWRWGFSAAAIGMFAGLIQFRLTERHLGEVGRRVDHPGQNLRRDWMLLWASLVALAAMAGLCLAGVVTIDPVEWSKHVATAIIGVAVLYFGWALLLAKLSREERRRVLVIMVLFAASALFWMGFEQAGSSFTIFAKDYTLREYWGWEFPAGWFQSVNPALIIILAPVMTSFWLFLARRNRVPSLTAKVAWAMLFLALGFVVAAWAAQRALSSGQVWPTWLFTVFLLHTIGELCLSPVGLSAMTKLSPPKLTGQMMGMWFLGSALGNTLAGILAGEVTGEAASQMPARFMEVVTLGGVAGVVLLVLAKPISKLMPGIK